MIEMQMSRDGFQVAELPEHDRFINILADLSGRTVQMRGQCVGCEIQRRSQAKIMR